MCMIRGCAFDVHEVVVAYKIQLTWVAVAARQIERQPSLREAHRQSLDNTTTSIYDYPHR